MTILSGPWAAWMWLMSAAYRRRTLRRGGSTGPFDLVVGLPAAADVAAFAAAGATWWLTDFDPATVTVDEVRGVLKGGPA